MKTNWLSISARARRLLLAGLMASTLPLFADANPYRDPDPEKVKDKVIEFLKKGGPTAIGTEADGRQIAEAGVNLVIGLADLGFPGMGAALGPLKDLFGLSSDQIPGAIERRLGGIERNLAVLESNVNSIAAMVNLTRNELRATDIRHSALLMRTLSPSLRLLVNQSKSEKQAYLESLLAVADSFLPDAPPEDDDDEARRRFVESDPAHNRWHWQSLRLKSTVGATTPLIEFTNTFELSMALEPYLQTVALLAAAAAASADAMTPEIRSRVLRHRAFLVGDDLALGSYNLAFSLRDRRFPVICSLRAASLPADQCSFTITCSDTVNTRRHSLAMPAQGHICLQLPEATFADWADTLTAQVEAAPNPLREVFEVAALRLGGGASSTPGSFDTSVRTEDYELYALNRAGRLLRHRHSIAIRDLWRTPTANPGSDCAGPSSRFREDCQGGLAQRGAQAPRVDVQDRPLARYQTTHEIEPGIPVTGDWTGIDALLPAQRGPTSFTWYGRRNDGVLLRHRISTQGDGPIKLLEGPKAVGHGWPGGRRLVATGEGIVYAVSDNGDLVWYRHTNVADGNGFPVFESRPVGRGWNDLLRIFSPGRGILYAIKADGTLLWFRHVGYREGHGLDRAGSWLGPVTIGSGWQDFTHVVSNQPGLIYAVDRAGRLRFYRHDGWESGTMDWQGPVTLAEGWTDIIDMMTPLVEPGAVIQVN